MLRACFASTSRTTVLDSLSCLHTTAINYAQRPRKRVNQKNNSLRKEERLRKAVANRPSVILGIRHSEEHKWKNCDLAKILVSEAELQGDTTLPTRQPIGTVQMPEHLSFGVGDTEEKMVFHDLPVLSAEAMTISPMDRPTILQDRHEANERKELKKANMFAKVIDLRNASAKGISFENRRRIIAEFSEAQNPFDPGRAEVQAALLTYKIRSLWDHLTKFKRDVGNRRGLRKLVHQRAKILRYLKRVDRSRYDTVLERLALEPESVEGELVV